MPRSDLLQQRVERWRPDLLAALGRLYDDPEAILDQLLILADKAHAQRPPELIELDRLRSADPGWFQRPDALGYATYVDRFAGTLAGVGAHADYLADLGVNYLHLMPLLEPRPSPNDGGYAVQDYRRVRADLGSMGDLRDLAATMRERGIALCLDLVVNHVAREHEWAAQARAGDPDKRAYFLVYPDRTQPDAYEQTLPEVFPDFAPGNFTWDADLDGWVWTTFNDYQWDLNWANPAVLVEFADIILSLANQGVEVFRLDAIAFLWKRLGTNCQNQPEVHDITMVLRGIAEIAAPAVLFKAEAIVGPDDLPAYLGQTDHAGKVSHLAYHNSLMVQIWSMLASRDVRLATQALQGFPQPPRGTAWLTYVRCHDDIGWAIADDDAAAAGVTGPGHRAFLADWYSGDFPGSWARGLVFQENHLTGDRRISGSLASLAGLECGDPGAVARILLAHAVIFGFGGLPVIWMGDELGLLNDPDWAADPAHAADNRWVHRQQMTWPPPADAHGILAGLRHLIGVRRGLPQLHAGVPTEIWNPRDPGVLLVVRRHPDGPLLGVYNMTPEVRGVPAEVFAWLGLDPTSAVDHLSGSPPVPAADGGIDVPPLTALWVTDRH